MSVTLVVFGFAAFALGGLVKGTLGVGLPMVVVPLLSFVMPGHQAIGWVAAPVLASNAWQFWENRADTAQVRRFAPLIVTLVASTLLTVQMTLSLSDQAIGRMIAAAVLTGVVLTAWKPLLRVGPSSEKAWGVGVGLVSGLLGGVSSLTGPLIISYLMALRLPRDTFVGCISVIYLCAALPLYGAMLWHDRLGPDELIPSLFALIPVWGGLRLGRKLRNRLGEQGFHNLLLVFLAALAIALLFK